MFDINFYKKSYPLKKKIASRELSINEIVLGNVNDNSLEEIWNGKKYQELRKMHISGKFPKGHKCSEKCDQVKLYEYLRKK